MKTNRSASEMATDNPKPQQENKSGYDKTFGSGSKAEPQKYMHEHDRVESRLGGKSKEISMGPHGAGLVPSNPFASLAQAGYMHSHPEILGKTALDEWDASSKGRKIPAHVKK